MQLRSGKSLGSTELSSTEPTSNKETTNYISPSYKVLRSGNTYGSHTGSKCFVDVRKFIHFYIKHPVRDCNSPYKQLYEGSYFRNHKSYPDAYDFIEDMWRTFKPHAEELTNNPLYEKLKISLERKIIEFVKSIKEKDAIFYSYRNNFDKMGSLKRAYELRDLYCLEYKEH